MIYLASPYLHPDPLIMRTRFLLTEQVTAELLMRGEHVYSPIVHCHEIKQKYDLPDTHEFWMRLDIDFLRRMDKMYILEIEGWMESKGVSIENRFATSAGIPVFFITPDLEVRPCA